MYPPSPPEVKKIAIAKPRFLKNHLEMFIWQAAEAFEDHAFISELALWLAGREH